MTRIAFFFSLFVTLTLANGLHAQTWNLRIVKANGKTHEVKHNKKVKVITKDDRVIKGYYSQVDSNSFNIQAEQISFDDVKSISCKTKQRNNAGYIVTGIGGGTTLGIGVAQAIDGIGFTSGLVVGAVLSAPILITGSVILLTPKKFKLDKKWELKSVETPRNDLD